MATVTLYDLGTQGILLDMPPHLQPPEAWSAGQNVRFVDGYAQRHPGHSSAFVPQLAAGFVFNVPGSTDSFWIYASKTAARGYSGGTDSLLTRLSGAYTASNLRDWNSCLLGGVPILNNGADVPQYWPNIALATRLSNLSNWPATLKAKVVRNFGQFLVAGNLTDTGSRLPHAVQWSSQADPGTIPASWDNTDATKEAGRRQLTDVAGGEVQDMQLLGSLLVIYKERAAHIMRFVGGNDIMGFDLLFNQGVFSPRSVAIIDSGRRHFVVGADDIYVHSGTRDIDYPLDKKDRRQLYARIDEDNKLNSFCYENPANEEVWFCYPTSGKEFPSEALVWNYRTRAVGFREFDGLSVDIGDFQIVGPTWDVLTGAWDTAVQPWSDKGPRRVIAASPLNTQMWAMDRGFQYGNDVGKLFSLQRTGLAIVGKARSGEPKADYTSQKLFRRIWPKWRGEAILEVRLGAQDEINGSVTWDAYKTYDPALRYLDFEVPGRLGAVEMRSTSDADGRLEGYDLEFEIVSSL